MGRIIVGGLLSLGMLGVGAFAFNFIGSRTLGVTLGTIGAKS